MKVTLPNGIVVDNIGPEDITALVPLIESGQTEEQPAPKEEEPQTVVAVTHPPQGPPRLVLRTRQNGDAFRTATGDLIMPRGLSDKLREVYTVIVEFGPIHIGEIAELLEIPKEKVSSRLHLLLNQHQVIERVRAGVYQAKG